MAKRTLTAVLAFLCLLCWGCGSGPVTLTIAGGASGQELDLTVDGAKRFERLHPNIQVVVRPTPANTSERLTFYQKIFDRQSSEVDVLQVDVIWPAIVASHAVDMRGYMRSSELEAHFPRILQSYQVDGKLVAVPWFTDLPVLYYRKDLLEKYGFSAAPKTWGELYDMASAIQSGEREAGRQDFWGYVWQGGAYEGLTCNALEWQYSHGGGNILDQDGNPTVNSEETAAAFQRASSWIADISPQETITFVEDDSRAVWQRGNAAFMRNWTNVYAISKQDAYLTDKFAVSELPSGGYASAMTLGGWGLMISRYSDHPREAAELVRFLTRDREQRRRAIEGSFAPTMADLYKDPAVLGAMPFFLKIEDYLNKAVSRPALQAGDRYDEVSQAYWQAAHDILNGADARLRLKRAEEEIRVAMSGESQGSGD
ncbi:MAG TPA: ABC transporter substrate-binding protein [Acidobacteriota bacterium]|nr:ABC transporter substrate-binding protein [Acidobacteriota bacterium]